MRRLIAILAGATLPVMALGATMANASAPEPTADPAQPPIKVLAPERMVVCRPVTRTGTRIDLSAVCRTREEWASNGGSMATRSYRDADHLADRLTTISRPCSQCWKD